MVKKLAGDHQMVRSKGGLQTHVVFLPRSCVILPQVLISQLSGERSEKVWCPLGNVRSPDTCLGSDSHALCDSVYKYTEHFVPSSVIQEEHIYWGPLMCQGVSQVLDKAETKPNLSLTP